MTSLSSSSSCCFWKKKKMNNRAEIEMGRQRELRETIGDVDFFHGPSELSDQPDNISDDYIDPAKSSDYFIDIHLESLKIKDNNNNNNATHEASSSAGPSNVESSQRALRSFSVSELKIATNHFSKLIGEGGFGPVYKGRLKATNQEIAVKMVNRKGTQGHNKEFLMEASIRLAKLQHQNLIKLIGFCNEDYYRMLVYEYMPQGSLADHLYDIKRKKIKPLDWKTRMRIALGAARGIEYLHQKEAIILGDLKPRNILLDGEFRAKLSGFGMAKVGPTCQVAKTFESDVFSFGVVLSELITARGHTDSEVAPRPVKYMQRSMKEAVHLAAQCVQDFPKERPSMAHIVERLERIVDCAGDDIDDDDESNAHPSA